jgi:hypothetical protein
LGLTQGLALLLRFYRGRVPPIRAADLTWQVWLIIAGGLICVGLFLWLVAYLTGRPRTD